MSDKIREENISDKIVTRDGKSFIASTDVKFISKAEIEEALESARGSLVEYDRLIAIERANQLKKIGDLETKLALFN